MYIYNCVCVCHVLQNIRLNELLLLKNMEINGHERLFNITRIYKLKYRNNVFNADLHFTFTVRFSTISKAHTLKGARDGP